MAASSRQPTPDLVLVLKDIELPPDKFSVWSSHATFAPCPELRPTVSVRPNRARKTISWVGRWNGAGRLLARVVGAGCWRMPEASHADAFVWFFVSARCFAQADTLCLPQRFGLLDPPPNDFTFSIKCALGHLPAQAEARRLRKQLFPSHAPSVFTRPTENCEESNGNFQPNHGSQRLLVHRGGPQKIRRLIGRIGILGGRVR